MSDLGALDIEEVDEGQLDLDKLRAWADCESVHHSSWWSRFLRFCRRRWGSR